MLGSRSSHAIAEVEPVSQRLQRTARPVRYRPTMAAMLWSRPPSLLSPSSSLLLTPLWQLSCETWTRQCVRSFRQPSREPGCRSNRVAENLLEDDEIGRAACIPANTDDVVAVCQRKTQRWLRSVVALQAHHFITLLGRPRLLSVEQLPRNTKLPCVRQYTAKPTVKRRRTKPVAAQEPSRATVELCNQAKRVAMRRQPTFEVVLLDGWNENLIINVATSPNSPGPTRTISALAILLLQRGSPHVIALQAMGIRPGCDDLSCPPQRPQR